MKARNSLQVTNPLHLIALFALLVLLLAGCGGKSKAESAAAEPTAAPVAAAPTSAPQGDAANGQVVFQTACVACHGPDATGVANLGKSLHASDSEYVSTHSDEELVDFIKVGRLPDDPLNTTGVAMPPKGGNPAISDSDLYDIVAWLRTLE